jgi:DNA repair exonuclease SbcCD ATPase subunit
MGDIAIDEKQLQADVDEVRGRITDTKDLYKWVCALLFFRYGITPTTNRLYQLVRKGSMGTVTTALSTFWQDLREKSRIQIDHPGVPEPLKAATGDFLQALWEKANQEAKAQFDAATTEAREKVAEAQKAAQAADAALGDLRVEMKVLAGRIEAAEAEKAALTMALEDERRTHGATGASLEASRTEVAALRQDLSEARRDFAAELEKARAAIRLAEERLETAERKALAEIERERTARQQADEASQQLRAELAKAEQAANTRIQAQATEVGELNGRLKAAEAEQSRRETELSALRSSAADWESKAARAEGSVAGLQERLVVAYGELERDPIERALELTRTLMKDYLKTLSEWKANDTEQLVLLGIRDPKLVKTWAAGEQIITPVSYERVVQVLGIRKRLAELNLTPRSADWVRGAQEGQPFKGKTPMDLMLHDGLREVGEYLEDSIRARA